MPQSITTRSRVIPALVLAVVVLIAGLLLSTPGGPLGDGLVRASYDSLHQLSGKRRETLSNSPIVIVYLDLNSFGLLNQDPTHPWSRELHAQLLRKLTTDGAKAVVFDIVFSTAGADVAADDAFTSAIHESGRTILAGESSGKISHKTDASREWVRASTISPPYELFANAAAGWGIASHIVDDDYVVRRYVAGGFGGDEQPSLTWAVAKFLTLPVSLEVDAMSRANGNHLRYYGPPLTIPHVSYAEALATNGTPQGFFRDKIIFIGARPLTGMFQGRQDEFRSPFHSWANRELFLPGVEVHATEMLNLIRGDGLNRTSAAAETVWLFLGALIFGVGLFRLRPVQATLVALAGIIFVMGVASLGFSRGVWFPWQIVAAVQIPFALGGSILLHSIEWWRTRRRYEARLREQAALIDKAHDAILVQELDGHIAYANPSAVRLYGWSSEELQRDSASVELFSPDAAAVSAARAAATQLGEWNGELRHQTKQGQIVTLASRWTLIRDDAGRPKALLQLNSDITDKKLLEQQFLRTQRMNTIGTLAGGMAHDLNNALAPILMGAQLLRRKTTDEESQNLLNLMESNTLRGADMVRQVLLFARGRGGEFERIKLAGLVRELEKMVAETFPKNIAVDVFMPRDLWIVNGNSTQIHQVLLNLCVNARDAMPQGGKLSFIADNVALTVEEATMIPDGRSGEFVSLFVSDTGTGMTREVLAKIFDAFFTTKGEGRGTGIGLATVSRILKAHGGFIRVESELGQGTSFELFLPRAVEIAPEKTPVALTDLPRGDGELILLAEDEVAIRELVAAELVSSGYRVLTATNGAEAVTLFRSHATEVRLLITDSAMPVMGGVQVIAELRAINAKLPVILTSGETTDQQGVIVVNKPFALVELLVAIQKSLREI